MTGERFTHKLTGCAPVPLAHYLKALGVIRLVSEQADATAQGWWSGDVFHLRSTLDRDGLTEFFTSIYRPTPIIAPWNGGSGFFLKDNRASIEAFSKGTAERFRPYREAISSCQSVLRDLNLSERPEGEGKEHLLIACRGRLSDEAVTWLDAAFVLTGDGPKYPPLLGTGGNDGRLEFTNNLMQRLLDLVDPQSGSPTDASAGWLTDAFYPEVQDDFQRDSILGQFDPGALERAVNPWDYVLMMEGAIMFAAAAVKRLESTAKGALCFPFCVRSAGVGYSGSAAADESSSRAELWLPLWNRPSTYYELSAVFSEGRSQVNGRTAKNGVDFARAVSTLGTDRGLDCFTRFGFHARNGLAYFAVPLGKFKVEPQPQVNLLSDIDGWLDSFRRAASSDNAPTRAQRALRRLEGAILDLCQQRGPAALQSVLVALGDAEAVLAVSAKWRAEAFQRPIPLLSAQWLQECNDDTSEFRLAASLASLYSPALGGLRQYLEPVEIKGQWVNWNENYGARRNVVWDRSDLESNLVAILQRRSIEAVRKGVRADDGSTLVFPGEATSFSSLGDTTMFLRNGTDDDKIASLIRGLTLLNWVAVGQETRQLQSGEDEPLPDAAFALLKLCHTPYKVHDSYVPLETTIAHLVVADRLSDAAQLAARRLQGSCLPPAIRTVARKGSSAHRIAAALLIPLTWTDTKRLAKAVLKPDQAAV
jgi:CRISPR-associated protein Csx17